MKEGGYCLNQRTIDCETRHEVGCEILDGFEDRVKNDVLHRSEADLGTIVVVTLPKFVVKDTANLELSRLIFWVISWWLSLRYATDMRLQSPVFPGSASASLSDPFDSDGTTYSLRCPIFHAYFASANQSSEDARISATAAKRAS